LTHKIPPHILPPRKRKFLSIISINKELKMTTTNNVFNEALTLRPSERAELIDKLLVSLDKSDHEIEKLWAKEVEDRIDAYDQGKIKSISLEEVLKKYG
jgi:putative addiction module component (TIGR02574 family)